MQLAVHAPKLLLALYLSLSLSHYLSLSITRTHSVLTLAKVLGGYD